MKKLQFHYEMQLNFSNPVYDHHYLFRCLPMREPAQQCCNLCYGIEPAGQIHEITDGFGNRTCVGEALLPHDSLNVWAEGTVFVDRSAPMKESLHPLFSFPSAYTSPDEELTGFFKTVQASAGERDGKTDLEFALYLMDQLYRNFSYVPGKTNVKTTAAEAFKGREGVCQDYAHILLTLLRLAGYPARYVAGMMVGEGATHAWTEVYLDGAWIGLDPTHNCLVGDHFIKLSHGRDFGDCTIDKGCFKGFASQTQKIYVKVDE